MSPSRRRIDAIADAAYLAGIEGWELAEVRRRRAECADIERELSYYRRLIHGRLDILEHAQRRRSDDDMRSSVAALPEILGSAPAPDAHATVDGATTAAAELPGPGLREIDFVLGDSFLHDVRNMSDAELADIRAKLRKAESSVARERSAAQKAHDALSAEIGRRYRGGETSVDELLRD